MDANGLIDLNMIQAARLNSKFVHFPFRLIPEEEYKSELKQNKKIKTSTKRVNPLLPIHQFFPYPIEPVSNLMPTVQIQPISNEPGNANHLNISLPIPPKEVKVHKVSNEELFMGVAKLVGESPVIQSDPTTNQMLKNVIMDIKNGNIKVPFVLGMRIEEILVLGNKNLENNQRLADYNMEEYSLMRSTVKGKMREILKNDKCVLDKDGIAKLDVLLSRFEKRRKKKPE